MRSNYWKNEGVNEMIQSKNERRARIYDGYIFAVKIHGISTAPVLLVDFGLDPSFIIFSSDN